MDITPDQARAELARRRAAQAQQPMTTVGTDIPGMVEPGNIDLAARPVVKNDDGSISTVRSMSFNEDGREILVPTVSPDGRIMSDQEAIDLYHKTGQKLGIFANPDDADRYAQSLHTQQEQMYAKPQTITPDMAKAELARRRAAADQSEAMQNAKALGIEPQQQSEQPEQSDAYRGTVLPLARDDNGVVDFAVPGIVKDTYESLKNAVTAPGRAMSGELQVTGPDGRTSPEAIAEGANFAMWASPASPASSVTPKPVAPAEKPEGLQVAEAGQRLGVDLPRAVTSDNPSVQQFGKVLSNVPIGGAPLKQASKEAIQQLDDAALKVQQGYGSGNAAIAGSAAREGITDYAKNTLKGLVGEKYDAVDALVTPNVTTPLESTAKAAAKIVADRENSKLPGSSKAVDLVQRALDTEGGLNYEGIKGLRTYIGDLLEDPARIAQTDVPEKELRSIYSGLSEDLRSAVKRGGGDEALSAFEKANSFAAKAAKDRENLQRVFGRNASDEGIFSKIVDMAGNTSRADQVNLMRVRKAVSPETWDEISSAVVAKMGRDASGDFSPNQFLTQYGKLSDQGKKMLFKTTGKENLAQSLDDLATVSQRFKQLNQYANPSGTGQTIMGGAMLPALYVEPVTAMSSVVGGRVAASLLAKPQSAERIAAWAKAYEQSVTRPSNMANTMLRSRAKLLSIEMAKEAGDASLAERFSSLLSNPRQLPANEGDNPPQGDEVHQGEAAGQPDQIPAPAGGGGW